MMINKELGNLRSELVCDRKPGHSGQYGCFEVHQNLIFCGGDFYCPCGFLEGWIVPYHVLHDGKGGTTKQNWVFFR